MKKMYKVKIEDWKILKRARRSDFAVIAAITAIFLLVIFMNIRLIFNMTSKQTEEIGQMQLEGIRSELSGTLSKAEDVLDRVAIESEQLLRDNATQEELTKFFYKKRDEQRSLTRGACFNVYVANHSFIIIPDFNAPPDYHAPERSWYKGAEENRGEIFITEPYIDAMTGEMCFTMAKMLSDGDNVVALDFNFSELNKYIWEMTSKGSYTALIVNRAGMIIGYSDMSLVGENISKKLPDYLPIFNRVIESQNQESFIDGDRTVFFSNTRNNWYLILIAPHDDLYSQSYFQMLISTLLNLAMMVTIILFYLGALSNGLKAERALHVKEEFLSHLSKQLREPLRKILNISSAGSMRADENPVENAAKVRESALQLSGMLDNLFSFSTMSTAKEKEAVQKNFQDKDLAKVSKEARFGVMTVLGIALTLSLLICIQTTISWGNTKIHQEVEAYDDQLSTWVEKQKTLLSVFVNLIIENPELMDDYDSAVKFLNGIAQHYPEISVCYLANPYKEHQVTMNNGWIPAPDYRVEKRDWYINTEKSENGFAISAPYYDAQTGLYCVTISQVVYGKNGEFLGIFAIDFFLDRLIQILGESYKKDSYAFLVDSNGVIINHPNKKYEMSADRLTRITNTEYTAIRDDGKVQTVSDYRGGSVACYAKTNKASGFMVIAVNDWWNIYGNIIALGFLFLLSLIICLEIVKRLINKMITWQESVNRKLQDASDTALAASQAKSQFLAQMSHEIRTPINAVLGMNEMILRESKNEDILDYSSNIQSAGRTLLTLINSILDFSKIEDGKMEIIPVRYETVVLIDDLVNMIAEKVKKKGLQFKMEIDSNLPKTMYGDDVRIRQVITNILTNAVKYTHTGSVTLEMNGTVIDDDTFELRVNVKDTGIGIRAEDMDKLFQSFQRLDEEKNRNIEGTGLGIAIVQKLLSMMNSKLEVSSEYGRGSNFSFKLMQKIIDKNPIGNYAEHHTIRQDESKNNKFLRAAEASVLAVDDNNLNLKVIRGLLKRNEIVPDLAESGMQCIEMVKKKFYHVIFLDNMMPVMNGIETLKKMKSENILSDKTTVVMLTASAIAGMRETYLREGFDDYLSKPIEVNELEEILSRHLPEDIVTYAGEGESTATKEVEKISEPEKVVEEIPVENTTEVEEEITDEDTFSAKEREFFEKTCPDFDLDTGLSYCMDSKSFLIEIMKEFKEDKKSEAIQIAFDAKDWKNYQVLVHALKSTALTIGAKDLSASAKEMEMAAKEGKTDLILMVHDILMEDYAKIRAEIKTWLESLNK